MEFLELDMPRILLVTTSCKKQESLLNQHVMVTFVKEKCLLRKDLS